MLKKQKDVTLKDSERFCYYRDTNVPPREGLPTACAFYFIYKGEKLISFCSPSHDTARILPLQSTSAFSSQEGEYSRLDISGVLGSCG